MDDDDDYDRGFEEDPATNDHYVTFRRRPGTILFDPPPPSAFSLISAGLAGRPRPKAEGGPATVKVKVTPEQWKKAGCPESVTVTVRFGS